MDTNENLVEMLVKCEETSGELKQYIEVSFESLEKKGGTYSLLGSVMLEETEFFPFLGSLIIGSRLIPTFRIRIKADSLKLHKRLIEFIKGIRKALEKERIILDGKGNGDG